MDDYPAAIADFLENSANKIRGLTVDRVRNWARWAAAGLVIAMLGLLIVVFLIVGVFRLLSAVVGVEFAYLILGGLFLGVGAFLWSKRVPKSATSDSTLDNLAENARRRNG